jgi:hypothetical protein
MECPKGHFALLWQRIYSPANPPTLPLPGSDNFTIVAILFEPPGAGMDIQIALAPDLEITAAQFAEAWNATPESRDAAPIRLETATGGQFSDPVADAAIAVITGLGSNAIYDLIKAVIQIAWKRKHPAAPKPPPAVNVVAIDQPGGNHVVVVTLNRE